MDVCAHLLNFAADACSLVMTWPIDLHGIFMEDLEVHANKLCCANAMNSRFQASKLLYLNINSLKSNHNAFNKPIEHKQACKASLNGFGM